MAIPDYRLCDHCDKKISKDETMMLDYDRQMDPSGNGYEFSSFPIDLCGKCWGALIQTINCSTDRNGGRLDRLVIGQIIKDLHEARLARKRG